MLRVFCIVAMILFPVLLASAADAPKNAGFPLWDGKETIADYAKRADMPPTLTLDLGGSTKLELVLIPAGSFVMGSPEGEAQGGDKGKELQHKVKLTRSFYLAKFELTQAQYERVMGANPSKTKGADLPVTNASWADAAAFCQKLTEQQKRTVRLPTEAEWEYACRAGTKTAYHTGDTEADLAKASWYGKNAEARIHPVGQKQPNAWGVYDMHGNAREFCADFFAPLAADDITDPTGPERGDTHVVKGGAFTGVPNVCRAAGRRPVENLGMTGFRVAVTVEK